MSGLRELGALAGARGLALALLVAAAGLGGCEKGPAERVGEKIDEATGNRSGAEQAGDELENAAEKAKDAAEETGDAARDATN